MDYKVLLPLIEELLLEPAPEFEQPIFKKDNEEDEVKNPFKGYGTKKLYLGDAFIEVLCAEQLIAQLKSLMLNEPQKPFKYTAHGHGHDFFYVSDEDCSYECRYMCEIDDKILDRIVERHEELIRDRIYNCDVKITHNDEFGTIECLITIKN